MIVAIFSLVLTVAIFFLATKIYQRFSYPLLNPFLITVTTLVAGLLVFNISYQSYNQGAKWITMLLEPAVVAFALPLYQQLKNIRRDMLALFMVIGCSAMLAISSTLVVAMMLGADRLITMSLVTHSVTTPIAIAVATPLGGEGALVAIAVLITGLIGALFGVPLLRLFGITSAKAQGVAIGVSSHALGTSSIMKQGETQGAYSALALVLCAIFTAIITPIVAPWLFSILDSHL